MSYRSIMTVILEVETTVLGPSPNRVDIGIQDQLRNLEIIVFGHTYNQPMVDRINRLAKWIGIPLVVIPSRIVKKDNVSNPIRKRPPNTFVYFKSHPDSQDDILTLSKEINKETGKILGKVRAAGMIWGRVSDEDKEEWKKLANANH